MFGHANYFRPCHKVHKLTRCYPLDELKKAAIGDLRLWANGLEADYIKAIFCVAVTEDGPTQVVLVEPEHREALIIGINDEVTRMMGSPHHIASAEKIARFLESRKISPLELLKFQAEESARDAAERDNAEQE